VSSNNKWPKKKPILTLEQKKIKEDFFNFWLTTYLPNNLGFMEKFNQIFPIEYSFFEKCKTLEIGAGVGGHLKYEDLDKQLYVAMELRNDLAQKIQEQYPKIKTIVGDCQNNINANDGYFDRILAIHVLEHLPNLPAAIKEIQRVLNPDHGKFIAIIPCEGGLALKCGRCLTTKKVFEKRYNQKYDWFIESEHINMPEEIISELKKQFKVEKMEYYPLKIPVVTINLCIGFVLTKKNAEY